MRKLHQKTAGPSAPVGNVHLHLFMTVYNCSSQYTT